MSAETKTKKAPPVEKIRVGNIRIDIWERQGGKNGKFFTAGKPELSYKDSEDKWQNDAGSYSRNDLLNLIKAAALADSAIVKLNRAHKAEDASNDDDGE